ncbi:hypothetical protein IE81DRAFT_357117, partial [Ceraceosorus guamensis]
QPSSSSDHSDSVQSRQPVIFSRSSASPLLTTMSTSPTASEASSGEDTTPVNPTKKRSNMPDFDPFSVAPMSLDSAAKKKPRGSPKKKKVKPEADDEGYEEDVKDEDGKNKRGGKAEAWTGAQKKALVMRMCAAGFPAVDWDEATAECGGRTKTQIKAYWNMRLKPKLEKALEPTFKIRAAQLNLSHVQAYTAMVMTTNLPSSSFATRYHSLELKISHPKMEHGSSPSGSPPTPTKRQSEGVLSALDFESKVVLVKTSDPAADTSFCASKTPKKEARSSTTQRSPMKVKPEPRDDKRSELEEQGQSSKRGGARTAWKPSEKKALVLGMCEAGMAHVDWTRMSEQCGGRSTVQIKSYWRMVLKTQLEKAFTILERVSTILG